MTRAASRCTIPGRRRLWRAPIAVLVCTVASSCWLTSSAAATVIEVNTLKETAVFDPPGPVYDSKIVGDNGAPGGGCLGEALAPANTDRDVFGCPAGNGNDTIRLMPGVYHILDNFFIQEKMTFVGPNKELAGNDPQRGPEAVLSLDNNPFWAAQVAMFWLDQPQATGDAKGAGTVFDGVEMRGGFKPNCAVAAPCEIAAIVQPSKIVQRGYTVTDSIVRNFSYGMYLGGTDTIARNVFEDNGQVPGSAANGYAIYSDFVYTAHDTSVTDNVFKNPLIAGVLLQGGENRDAVVGGVIARNAFLKKVNSNVAAFVANTSGVLIKDNLFWRPGPVALPSRGDSAIRLDKVNDVQIIGNTITGWGAAISIGSVGTPGPPGSTDVTAAFNRIYDNRFGVKVTPVVLGGDTYAPLGVDATDNWWGANGGPGSAAGRPGAASPVNGVQFLTTFGVPVPSQPGIRVDRSLQLTCSAPAAMQTNVPASVSGQVLRMPTVNSTASKPPWFLTRVDPIMAASAPD